MLDKVQRVALGHAGAKGDSTASTRTSTATAGSTAPGYKSPFTITGNQRYGRGTGAAQKAMTRLPVVP